jgi:hypothetical protein
VWKGIGIFRINRIQRQCSREREALIDNSNTLHARRYERHSREGKKKVPFLDKCLFKYDCIRTNRGRERWIDGGRERMREQECEREWERRGR